MTIQLTIYIVKWLYNWLNTNDYIQLSISIVKWLHNWLYTNDYRAIEYIHSQIDHTIDYIQMTIYNWQHT